MQPRSRVRTRYVHGWVVFEISNHRRFHIDSDPLCDAERVISAHLIKRYERQTGAGVEEIEAGGHGYRQRIKKRREERSGTTTIFAEKDAGTGPGADFRDGDGRARTDDGLTN